MDRLSALFENMSLPEIARVLRRTVFSAIGIGVVAFAVAALLSHALLGLGVLIGLTVGLVNIRMITRSVAKVNAMALERPRRVLASRTLYRLSFTTILIVAMLIASFNLGFGAAGGIALFYFALLANLVRELLRQNPGVAL